MTLTTYFYFACHNLFKFFTGSAPAGPGALAGSDSDSGLESSLAVALMTVQRAPRRAQRSLRGACAVRATDIDITLHSRRIKV